MISSKSIAVVFATHNGQDTLPEMLDGYTQIRPDSPPWRLVIVNNGSTDNTSEILRSYASSLPLTILDEPTAGKNRALNLALRSFESFPDLVIFSDDDAIPTPDFIVNWHNASMAMPDHQLFAGTVDLKFREAPHRLELIQKYEPYFAEIYARNLRAEDGDIPADAIFGPNMAVRGSIFEAGFKFNEAIGPNSSQALYPMGSETEFCTRVERETGCKSWFATAPRVQHIVREWQMTPDFIQKRAYRHGRGTGARHLLTGTAPTSPLAHIKSKIKQTFRRVRGAVGSEAAKWDYHWAKGYDDATVRGRSSQA